MKTVHAYPKKQFFLQMFTRDISLEDCILDLIDNSMDSLLQSRNIDIETQVLNSGVARVRSVHSPARISVRYSEDRFEISDNCGGFSRKDAENEVFCFGHSAHALKGKLGVYGIGLKRAIFKLGNQIEITSSTMEGSFVVSINVPKWAEKDDSLDDWTFPISKVNGAVSQHKAGTSIVVTDLHQEVKVRIGDGTVESTLRRVIGQTYPVFLGTLVTVKVNDIEVERRDLPFGNSDEIEPGVEKFEHESVKVTLLATVAPKVKRTQEVAGWYVLCNGRVVVNADKTDLTGWGVGLPAFHSKYLGFVGLALFTSQDPSLLPWTTSKRGLNREAVVYQLARNKMSGISRPVISFLNDMYPSELPEQPVEREIAERVQQQDFRPLLHNPSKRFEVIRSLPKRRKIRVQYDVEMPDLERIRKKIRRPSISASAIGKLTFDHYLKTECPE